MNSKPLYQHFTDLLDFSEEISALIQPGEPEINSYFMTLVYIEDILDKYGRGLASQSVRQAGFTEEQISTYRSGLNQRLEMLRARIRSLSQSYNFDQVLLEKGQTMVKEWQKQ
jgi:hypothetical protein